MLASSSSVACAAPASRPAAVSKRGNSESKSSDPVLGESYVTRDCLAPTRFTRHVSCVHSKIGLRKTQEDRFVMAPEIFGVPHLSFFGVMDGTVGHHASDFAHHHLLPAVVGSPYFREAVADEPMAKGGFLNEILRGKVELAIREGYARTDDALIRFAAEHSYHYTSSTSVSVLIAGTLLTVAHLGDSRVALGREVAGTLTGTFLTVDHKPDIPEERARIEACGGSLTYLHGGKPFIRGGDFTARQAKGERPMQLNYSRAFGGKDLKPFGLSAEPDVLQMPLTKADKVIVLGSDGLWDVVSADIAVRRAMVSLQAGRDASQELTDYALHMHSLRGSVDNVTVMVIALTH